MEPHRQSKAPDVLSTALVRRVASCVAAMVCGVLLTGCSDSLGTVPVTGRVTLRGEPMPGPGSINFLPVKSADGFPTRPASGSFESDGAFAATSFEEGDGLLPGRYQVSIHCWEVPPSMEGPPRKSYIAIKFTKGFTSGLEELIVEPGEPVVVNYDLE